MLLKRFHDDNEPIVALKRFCIYKNGKNIRKHQKTSENIGAWAWNGMEQEDFGNIGVGKALECGKMSEECGKHRKCQSVE